MPDAQLARCATSKNTNLLGTGMNKGKKSRGASTTSPWGRCCVLFWDLHLLSVASLPHRLSKPPCTVHADGCCRENRRSLRSPTDGARAPRVCGLRLPPLVSWRSWLLERLSFLRSVLGLSLSQRVQGCSERCLPEAYGKHLVAFFGDVLLRISISRLIPSRH